MKLWSDAIDEKGFIESRYTCDIDNSSPELRWAEANEQARGFVILMDDLDTPQVPFSHWVVYNIPQTVSHLPTGIPPQDMLPNGIRQGLNGFGKLGYYGPCPAYRSLHRYIFRLYALREVPELPARINREQLLERISGFVLETAEVHCQYQRAIERAG